VTPAFDERLLEVLVCPATRTKLRYDEGAQELVADEAAIAYPIRDGVPVMLIEEARRLSPPRNGEGDRAQRGGGVDGGGATAETPERL
jgi:hypothetical protein